MPADHPGWGGKRYPVGGRPRADRHMRKTAVTLWPEQIARLKEIGDGSASEGIRRVLAHYEQSGNSASVR